jgi:hypothetical protein
MMAGATKGGPGGVRAFFAHGGRRIRRTCPAPPPGRRRPRCDGCNRGPRGGPTRPIPRSDRAHRMRQVSCRQNRAPLRLRVGRDFSREAREQRARDLYPDRPGPPGAGASRGSGPAKKRAPGHPPLAGRGQGSQEPGEKVRRGPGEREGQRARKDVARRAAQAAGERGLRGAGVQACRRGGAAGGAARGRAPANGLPCCGRRAAAARKAWPFDARSRAARPLQGPRCRRLTDSATRPHDSAARLGRTNRDGRGRARRRRRLPERPVARAAAGGLSRG